MGESPPMSDESAQPAKSDVEQGYRAGYWAISA